jgi:hypothetical protein
MAALAHEDRRTDGPEPTGGNHEAKRACGSVQLVFYEIRK